MRIPLSSPDITDHEIKRVCDVLRSGVLSLGPCTEEFEEKFAEYIGTRFAIAVSSGTSALHLAVKAIGITPGAEVITTSFSFVASTNCFLYEGAFPVFLDIDPYTLNLDPGAILRFLVHGCRREGTRIVNLATGRNVEAILPVHVFGLPCDMEPICHIARQFGLHVIEDACEALGASIRGRSVGTFGEVAAFAFYPNKQITTGEGGMLVTNNERIAEECRSRRNQGRATNQNWLQHERLGYNYRLSDIHSALGVAQLERLSELLHSRQQVAQAYNRALSPLCRSLKLPIDLPDASRSWFVYVVQLLGNSADRDKLIAELNADGISSKAYFPAIHLQPYIYDLLAKKREPLPNTEHAAATCIALPFFSRMTDAQVEYVSQSLGRMLSRIPARVLATAS